MATTRTRDAENSEPLNMRIKPSIRSLIDRAAALVKQNRTDFMLEAAEQRAQRVLLDRVVFPVSPEVYAQFVERLDAPANPNDRLKRTMTTKAPWDAA
ncbi:DUF1778 domain-containing protein [Bosea sp. CCNWLW174]|uniref:type II toxin-antitoxin system TacA family antitoxin n=1 Tax=unclassified Bosea (in: a-proteobacteria) TaxID=2653178 RepID=UPI0030144625